jgi:hypothetical protein
VPVTATTEVAAFATVDLDVNMSPPVTTTTFELVDQGDGIGSGTVTSDPAGIDCSTNGTTESGTCSAAFPSGVQVALSVTPDSDAVFDDWGGGGCTGSGETCIVTMEADTTVTASFALACNPAGFTIDNAQASFGADGGSGTVSVSAPAGCEWTAPESAGWIQITSGSSGSGTRAVSYAVDPNSAATERSAVITVAGRTHRVIQGPASCLITMLVNIMGLDLYQNQIEDIGPLVSNSGLCS